ncbi:hypothetical protein BH09BAC4_BH09BAC4_17080 [soil metagenome]
MELITNTGFTGYTKKCINVLLSELKYLYLIIEPLA